MKHRRLIAVTSLVLLLLSGIAVPGVFYDDLTLNYSDYSYVSSVAASFKYAYFGTTNGVIRYDIVNEKWDEPYPLVDNNPLLSINRIEAEFDDQNIYVSTDNGLYEYSEMTYDWSPIDDWPQLDNKYKHIYPEGQYVPPFGFTYMNEGALTDDRGRIFQLTDIVVDDWNNQWIGTWGLGPARADEHHYNIELENFGLLQKDVTTIFPIDDRMWLGGLSGDSYRTGFTIFDYENNKFEYSETFGNLIGQAVNVFQITGNEEYIYAGTDDGILVIDVESGNIIEEIKTQDGLPDLNVRCLAIDDNYLYAGTPYGLSIFGLGRDSAQFVSKTLLAERSIESLYLSDHYLWIGTDRGGYRLNLENSKLGRLKAPEITQNGDIYDIDGDENKIWMATSDELVSIDLHTADIELFPEVNAYGGINAVAVNDTITAAAVAQGLMLIYTGNSKRNSLYTVNDGLISNNIRDMVFIDDFLWLATDRGLTRFWYKHPELY